MTKAYIEPRNCEVNALGCQRAGPRLAGHVPQIL